MFTTTSSRPRRRWQQRLTAIRVISACAALALALSAGALTGSAGAQENKDVTYDWTIKMQTQPLDRHLEYRNSRFRNGEGILVEYYPRNSANNAQQYERLWYHDGKPLGLERLAPWRITSGDGVCIELVHKTGDPTPAELRSAANAILHLVLDAGINRNPVVMVRIPATSLHTIAGHLQTLGCTSVSEEGNAGIILLLVSDPEGQKLRLAYL